MKKLQYLKQEEVIRKGMSALLKELGPVEAMRFINLPIEKRKESVARHRAWQDTLDKDVFFDQIFGNKT